MRRSNVCLWAINFNYLCNHSYETALSRLSLLAEEIPAAIDLDSSFNDASTAKMEANADGDRPLHGERSYAMVLETGSELFSLLDHDGVS